MVSITTILAQSPSQIVGSEYLTVAFAALPVYEYLITFAQSCTAVWGRKISATSILIISVRWVMLATALSTIMQPTQKNCRPLDIVSEVLEGIAFAQAAAFSALRVFALGGQDYGWTSLVLFLGLIPVFTSLYEWICTGSNYVSIGATLFCDSELTALSPQVCYILLFCTRSTQVLVDIIVLAHTWNKTYRQWREGIRLNIRIPVTQCLLRDGTWYFLALLAMNAAEMITNKENMSLLTPLVSVLPSILINRFLLNLRMLGHESTVGSQTSSPGLPGSPALPVFAHNVPKSLIGNIGEDLCHGYADGSEEEEDAFGVDEVERSNNEERPFSQESSSAAMV